MSTFAHHVSMSGFRIRKLANGVDSTDAINLGQLSSALAAITLDSLSDVVLTAVTSGDTFYYNGTNWVNTSNMSFNGTRLALPTTGLTGGVLIGGDAQIYRSAADTLRTPDSLTVDANLTVGTLTATRVPFASTGGLLVDSSGFTYTSGTGQLALSTTGSGGGLLVGGDVQIYRSAANQWYTPDYFQVAGPTFTSTSATQAAVSAQLTFTPSASTSGRAWGMFFSVGATGANNFTDSSGSLVGLEGSIVNNSTGTMTAAACAIFGNSFGANSTTSRFTGVDIYGPDVSGSAGTGATVTDHQGIILRGPRSSGNTSLGNVPASMLIQFRAATWSGTGHITAFTNIGYFSGHSLPSITANNQTRIFIDVPSMPSPASFTGTTVAAMRMAAGTTARDGLLWGTDTNLYRSAADNLKTDDKFSCNSLQVGTSSTSGQALCASDSSGNVSFQTVIRKRSLVVPLCMAFTPSGTGADAAEFTMPYSPTDGTTSITWVLRRITLRVNVAGGAPAITLEKSTATGAFSATTMGTATMGSGNYEVSVTSGFSSNTVASGNKIRFNVGTLGTATGWTFTAEFEEQ